MDFLNKLEYDVYFGKDDSRLLIFSGDEVLENISFEKKLIGNSPIVSIKATNILGNETVLKIPSGLYVWHAKKKLAEEYKKDINKIQLLMNSEVLHDYQKISSISLNNEIQVQVIFTQNS